MREMRWRLLGHFGLRLACAASEIAGAYLVVRAFATSVEPFTLGIRPAVAQRNPKLCIATATTCMEFRKERES
jgi:hypothetical protein